MKNEDVDLIFNALNNYTIQFDDTSYFDSYFEFIEFFKKVDLIDKHSLIISSYFTYGWMPTILKKFNITQNMDVVISNLNKVKNQIELNDVDYLELVKCINNSIVGVSKLLHFINPIKYPIFDSRIKKFFKYNKISKSIWKPTYQNKEKDIEQYKLYRTLCLKIISDSRFERIYNESIQQLGFKQNITKMRVLENLFFTFGKID